MKAIIKKLEKNSIYYKNLEKNKQKKQMRKKFKLVLNRNRIGMRIEMNDRSAIEKEKRGSEIYGK